MKRFLTHNSIYALSFLFLSYLINGLNASIFSFQLVATSLIYGLFMATIVPTFKKKKVAK